MKAFDLGTCFILTLASGATIFSAACTVEPGGSEPDAGILSSTPDATPSLDSGIPVDSGSDSGTINLPDATVQDCPGMDGTADNALTLVDSSVTLPPARGTVDVGNEVVLIGSEFDPFSGRVGVISGTPHFSTTGVSYFATSSAPTKDHRASKVYASDLDNVLHGPDAKKVASSYTNLNINSVTVPGVWPQTAETPPLSFSFYRAQKSQVPGKTLTNLKRGPNWLPDHLGAVQVRMVNYGAYAVHVTFDSQCKYDQYLLRAGGVGINEVFAGGGTLQDYLRKSKAKLRAYAIGLGPHEAMKTAFAQSSCGTKDLPACAALIAKLDAILDAPTPLPSVFAGSPGGSSSWYAETLEPVSTTGLTP